MTMQICPDCGETLCPHGYCANCGDDCPVCSPPILSELEGG